MLFVALFHCCVVFIDLCIALHNCLNMRVRYDATCRYSYLLYIYLLYNIERSSWFESINRWTGGGGGIPVYILCKAKSKAGRRKHLKFDHSGTAPWPEHGEKTHLTRNKSRSFKNFACQTQVKTESIGKYCLMIVKYFDNMLCCEFGAWMPDYERGQTSLLNLA